MVLMDLCNKKQWKLMEIREHVYTLTLVQQQNPCVIELGKCSLLVCMYLPDVPKK